MTCTHRNGTRANAATATPQTSCAPDSATHHSIAFAVWVRWERLQPHARFEASQRPDDLCRRERVYPIGKEDGKGRRAEDVGSEGIGTRGPGTHPVQLPARKLVELVDGEAIDDWARDALHRGLHHLRAILCVGPVNDVHWKRGRKRRTLTTRELALLCSYARRAPLTSGRLDTRERDFHSSPSAGSGSG